MADDHPGSYFQIARNPISYRPTDERIQDYREIYEPVWESDHLQQQGARCMDCGVPACMAGCPIGNIIPDFNDLVARNLWREALDRLHATNNFPEFTGYTCPAPCEPACVLSLNTDPVTIKSIERAIVDRGWAEGWIVPVAPENRTGRRVAVVGSGPAGLAAAQQLNRAGHTVTVFERDDEIGGLMVYGIPDFKFAKLQVKRRVEQLSAEGILFEAGVNVGRDVTLEQLQREHDAVCLTIGAQKPRQLTLPGGDLGGIHYAMRYLKMANQQQAGKPVPGMIDATDRNVIVLGGGDTGADCVATAHRQGAKQVVQISINPRSPDQRAPANPWPEWPLIYRRSYAIEEGGTEEFSIDVTRFIDEDHDGSVNCLEADRVEWTYQRDKRRPTRSGRRVVQAGLRIPADLVLVAIGYAGPEVSALGDDRFVVGAEGNLAVDSRKMTSVPGVFAAGDAVRGQSIVVWAIGEGRDVAREIDAYLGGAGRIPYSLKTVNPPLNV